MDAYGVGNALTNLIFMTENVDSGAAVSFIESKKEATIAKMEEINEFYREYP